MRCDHVARLLSIAGGTLILIASDLALAQSGQPASKSDIESTKVSQSSANENPTADKDPGSAPATRAEVEALERRVEQLEIELKEERARNLADTDTTAALKKAEKNLLQGAAPATAPTAVSDFADPRPDMGPVSSSAAPVEKPATTNSNGSSTARDAHATAFSDWDWTWLNGNPRNKDVAFDSKFFTPEIRADVTYNYDFNHPVDHSIGGSTEIFRANEIQVEQLGVGGDFHYENAHARLMTQFGMYSSTSPRNDPSYAKGQWDLSGAYRYLSEAYAGYQISNVMHGINFDPASSCQHWPVQLLQLR